MFSVPRISHTHNATTFVKRLVVCFAALALPFCSSARAEILMDSVGGFGLAEANQTIGYEFRTSVPFLITDLGIFDFNGDGLAQSHVITLYTVAGTPVLSATIAVGEATPTRASSNSLGFFRTVDVPDTELLAGNYIIAAFYSGDAEDFVMGGAAALPATGVTYIQNRLGAGDVFPTNTFEQQEQGYFGPTLIGTAVTVPEAGTLGFALPALGMIGAVGIRRRKK